MSEVVLWCNAHYNEGMTHNHTTEVTGTPTFTGPTDRFEAATDCGPNNWAVWTTDTAEMVTGRMGRAEAEALVAEMNAR